MADIIVYNQEELDRALALGIKSITLCAGVFSVHKTKDVTFDRIGPVRVEVLCSKPEAETAGMVFIDTYPTYRSAYAMESRASMAVVAAFSSGSFYGSGSGSFLSGGSGYGIGSGRGSGSGSFFYEYEFEYEYGGSFRGSFGGSYTLSRGGSYTLSSGGSYTLSSGGSYSLSSGGSYSLSLGYSMPSSAQGSYKLLGSCAGYTADMPELKTIKVFGYGINLI
ncbi:MAG: hypothetical protein ACI4TH_01510 [Candidatus Ornithomonoglobus sp.]